MDFRLHAGEFGLKRGKVEGVARAAHHADFGNRSYEFRAEAPVGEIPKRIAADQQVDFRILFLIGDHMNSINGVVRTWSFDLDTGKFKSRVVSDHALQHGQTMLQWSDRLSQLIRRVWRENPEQLIELKLKDGFCRKDKMTDMRRVEGAAKETDAFWHGRKYIAILIRGFLGYTDDYVAADSYQFHFPFEKNHACRASH